MKSKIASFTQHELFIVDTHDRNNWKKPMKMLLPHKLDIVHHPSWMPNGINVILEYRPWTENIRNKENLSVINIQAKKMSSFKADLFKKNSNLILPKWSTDGKFLAILRHQKTAVIKDDEGKIKRTKSVNNLIVFDKITNNHKTYKKVCADWAPLSWLQDSKKNCLSKL